jgi:hypothetical protein
MTALNVGFLWLKALKCAGLSRLFAVFARWNNLTPNQGFAPYNKGAFGLLKSVTALWG